jgi:hypothetical protein
MKTDVIKKRQRYGNDAKKPGLKKSRNDDESSLVDDGDEPSALAAELD